MSTDLGLELTFPDTVVELSLPGNPRLTKAFASRPDVFQGKKPSVTHPALEYVLPTCNAAVTAAGATGIFDGLLLLSMAYQESRLNPRAKTIGGTKGKPVRGLIQFVYETGISEGIIDFYNPAESIHAAAKYLKYCWEQYASVKDPKKRLAYAVMGYNGGPGTSVQAHDSGLRFNIVKGLATKISTKIYAKDIDTAYKAFAGIPALSEGPLKFV